MELLPLSDHVVVERRERERTTEGGIVIPDSASDRPTEATVRYVGPGKRHNGDVMGPEVKEGDRVLYRKNAGTEITIDGREYLILTEDDILARIEE